MCKKKNAVESGKKNSKFFNKGEYPLYEDAKRVLKAMAPAMDEDMTFILTKCFCCFPQKIQAAVARFFVDEYHGRIMGINCATLTGIEPVDVIVLHTLYDLDVRNMQRVKLQESKTMN